MAQHKSEMFSAPWLLATAFLLLLAAFIEKGLNLIGLSIPLLDVYPRQLLDWAVAVAIFEIALTVRQIFERGRASTGP